MAVTREQALAELAQRAGAPDANPKTRYGLAKPGLSTTPTTALLMMGRVFDLGAKKYGAFNWRKDPVSASIYYDAMLRHSFQWYDGVNDDIESKMPHLAHTMACCGIILDAHAHGTLNDNRPTPGKLAETIARLTTPNV